MSDSYLQLDKEPRTCGLCQSLHQNRASTDLLANRKWDLHQCKGGFQDEEPKKPANFEVQNDLDRFFAGKKF